MVSVVAAGVLGLAAVAALLVGPAALAVLVVAVGAVALIDLSSVLARSGARPVLPAALVPGVAMPLLIALEVAGEPAGAGRLAEDAWGWDRAPEMFAVALILGFALVLVFGRRSGATAGVGATMTASLVVGLGTSSLLLLRALPDGFRWTAALLALVLAADVATPLSALLRSANVRNRDYAYGYEEFTGFAEGNGRRPAGVTAMIVAVVLVGAGAYALLAPPIGALAAALMAMIALFAAVTGAHLSWALTAEAGTSENERFRLGDGLVFGLVDTVLIAAPAAYVLALTVT